MTTAKDGHSYRLLVGIFDTYDRLPTSKRTSFGLQISWLRYLSLPNVCGSLGLFCGTAVPNSTHVSEHVMFRAIQ
jgi:hypothetical protein